jgi:hypothetical protein
MSLISKSSLLVLACLLFIPRAGAQVNPVTTRWIADSGNWHDPANWNMGVPNATTSSFISQGHAQIDAPATSNRLTIGGVGSAAATATAPLTVIGSATVGQSAGTGQGRTLTQSGSLTLTSVNLEVVEDAADPFETPASFTVGSGGGTGTNTVFTGIGNFSMSDGDVTVEGGVGVGDASGTGTNTQLMGMGTFHVLRGDVNARGAVRVGAAGGTGTATITAIGNMLVEHGDIIVSPDPRFGGGASQLGHFPVQAACRASAKAC